MTSADSNKPNKQSPDAENSAAPGTPDTQGSAGETPTAELKSQVASLREQLEAAASERDTNYDRLLRAQAELENYRKRVQKEMDEYRQYQSLPMVRDLLPGLDNLQRALTAAAASKNIDDLVQGVEMVAHQFQDILSRHAVVPIEAAGKPFDPNLHEAIQQMPSEQPAMTVVNEVERGYTMHDRVVRPSKVIVSSGPPKSEESE
jgi:molecular chaperone GrpE